MKESELRKRATCCMCHKKLGQTGHFLFYVVTIQRYCLNESAIRRQSGLEMMLGGCAFLAGAMGPDEDLAKEISTATVTVCERCSMTGDMLLPRLNEAAGELADNKG